MNISFTASGHYFIAMSRTNKAITHLVENKSTENILLSISSISFLAYSANILQKLVKSSSINDDKLLELFDKIEINHEICMIYKNLL